LTLIDIDIDNTYLPVQRTRSHRVGSANDIYSVDFENESG